MKNIITISIVTMLALMQIAFAQTTITTTWQGSGSTSTQFITNDASYLVKTTGDNIQGTFTGTNYENNPYNYGISNTEAKLKASVDNGKLLYSATRLTSYSMYGDAGQNELTYIETNGHGELVWFTTTNFAEMRNCLYNHGRTTNGHHIEVNGQFYFINQLTTKDNGAYIEAQGNGNAWLDLMSSEAVGNHFNYGKGCGCYKDAKFNSEGQTTFHEYAWSKNSLYVDGLGATINGDGTDNSATYEVLIHGNNIQIPDVSLGGN